VQSALPLVGGGAWNIVNTFITKETGVEGAAAYLERVVEEIAVSRIGQPEHIGNAVVLLALDATRSGTGRELSVDGGQGQVNVGHNWVRRVTAETSSSVHGVRLKTAWPWADAAPGGRADPGTDSAPHLPCDRSAAGDDFNRPWSCRCDDARTPGLSASPVPRGPSPTGATVPANIGYATPDASSPLAPLKFDRSPVGPEDVLIDIRYCGVCHSDVHQARDEFDGALATTFPCMPGHEIVGIVAETGSAVTQHSIGDRVGVGCLVYWGAEDQRGGTDEQYQNPPAVFTYNAPDPRTGEMTFGGYSDQIVVNEHFVLRIPDSLPLEKAAPLLCAGVTTWSPLRRWNVGTGQVVGVAGVGGLGHMAIQLAKARGAEKVIALTTTPDKKDEILRLGADEVVVMSDEEDAEAHAASLDFLLSTIPTPFDMNPYVSMVRTGGTLITVGMLEPTPPAGIDFAEVSTRRITVGGSLIGSVAETQEVLDFCAEHGITADVQVIPVQQSNEAYDQMVAKDVRFRFVIDNATLRTAGA
jgi:uncharacterized zinc-type alcohol dehydrogenase-like protein